MTSTTDTCRRKICTNKPVAHADGHCEKHAYALGYYQPFVDGELARNLIDNLHQQGHTYCTISLAAGLSESSVYSIVGLKLPTVRGRVYKGLLAAQAKLDGTDPDTYHRPVWPLARRLRALSAAGHPNSEIIEATGLRRGILAVIRNERKATVSKSTDQAIRDYYAAHELDPVRPPAPAFRDCNWPKPMEWNDIDDPDETPFTAPTYTELRTHIDVSPELQEKAQYLADFYGSYYKAALQIGTNNTSLRHVAQGHVTTVARVSANAITAHYEDVQVGAHAPILRAS